jgi:hypothetical protein
MPSPKSPAIGHNMKPQLKKKESSVFDQGYNDVLSSLGPSPKLTTNPHLNLEALEREMA